MATPVLLPEEYQFKDDGVKLNTDAVLPFVDVTSIDGLDSAPVRSSSTAREGTHGGWVDASFDDVRVVTIEATAYVDPLNFDTYLDTLKANLVRSATVQPLYIGTDVGEFGSVRAVYGKCLGARYAKSTRRRTGIQDFQVQFLCENPRILTPDPVVKNLTNNVSTAVDLDGNRETTGVIRINGPRSSPILYSGPSSLSFVGLTISSGQYVDIDLDRRTVIKNDGTNLRNSMAVIGGWPVLNPGSNFFQITSASGTGITTVTARSAWR